MNTMPILQAIAAAVGALGFSVLFNIRGKNLIFAALGGGLSWGLFLILELLIESEAICYFIVALMASLYAEAMARLLRSPATIFIAPSMIPLVPGASLYYTMANALDGNVDGFIKKGIDTLTLAAALSIGVIVSAVIMRTVTKLTAAAQKRKKQC